MKKEMTEEALPLKGTPSEIIPLFFAAMSHALLSIPIPTGVAYLLSWSILTLRLQNRLLPG